MSSKMSLKKKQTERGGMSAVLPRLLPKNYTATRLFTAYCHFTGAERRALAGFSRRHVSIDINSRKKHLKQTSRAREQHHIVIVIACIALICRASDSSSSANYSKYPNA